MRNYVQPGTTINAAATHPAVPVSGDPVIVGTIAGVAVTNEGADGNASGESTIATEGVCDLPVTGIDEANEPAAVARGDRLYYADGVLSQLRKQIDTITLTGTSGTANVTQAGGLNKTATFDTDLPTTAENFVTAHAAAYLAVGIVVTSAAAKLIFTANVAGVPFAHPVITNVTGNLAGTVANTRSNGVLFGKALGTVDEGETDPLTETIPVMLIQA